VDTISAEDAIMNARLKNICRGCWAGSVGNREGRATARDVRSQAFRAVDNAE